MPPTLGAWPHVGTRLWSGEATAPSSRVISDHLVIAKECGHTFILSWRFRTSDEHAAVGVAYPLTITDTEIQWLPEFQDPATREERIMAAVVDARADLNRRLMVLEQRPRYGRALRGALRLAAECEEWLERHA